MLICQTFLLRPKFIFFLSETDHSFAILQNLPANLTPQALTVRWIRTSSHFSVAPPMGWCFEIESHHKYFQISVSLQLNFRHHSYTNSRRNAASQSLTLQGFYEYFSGQYRYVAGFNSFLALSFWHVSLISCWWSIYTCYTHIVGTFSSSENTYLRVYLVLRIWNSSVEVLWCEYGKVAYLVYMAKFPTSKKQVFKLLVNWIIMVMTFPNSHLMSKPSNLSLRN